MTDAQYQRRLQAIHAQAAGVMVSIEALMADCGEAPVQAATKACPHPKEKRENIATLSATGPKYRCRECGQENV